MAGHKRNFGGSNDIRSGRNEFGNVHFGGSNEVQSGRNEFNNVSFGGSNQIQSGRNEFNNVFFRGDREVDHNKTQFNRSGAFDDGMSYFAGNSPDTFAYTNDRNISYNGQSSCGTLNARGKKRPPINPFAPTTGGYDPYGARQSGSLGCPSGCTPCLIGGGCCEGGYGDGAKCRGAARQGGSCQPPLVMDANGNCVQQGLGGDPTGRKKKRYSTQADDPANRRKLNAKGRAASLPKAKANEKITDYANRIGYKLLDPDNILGDRVDGCSCRCMGGNTGPQESGIYGEFPHGLFIKCCGGRICAHVGTFGARQLIVQPVDDRVLSGVKPRRTSNKPPRKGKPVAKGSGKMRKTKKGLFLVNDIGDDIPVTPQEQSHPCCNSGNLCSSTFNCLDGSGSYPITGCCGSVSYCSGLGDGLGSLCGGAYEIVPSPATPNLQGSANFRGRDLSNGGFRLR